MAFEQKYRDYGVLKIVDNNKKVQVHFDRQSFITLQVNENITNALWAGENINVYLSNGQVRKYSAQQTYTTV